MIRAICVVLILQAGPACAQLHDWAALSRHASWHRLLHYDAGGFGSTGVISALHSDAFFLSPDGRVHPQHELEATWQAMQQPVVEGAADNHAKCRFPARRQWLAQMLPAHRAALAEIDCAAFRTWRSVEEIESISLVFANGYLGNPASYYGHLFLKLNGRRGKGVSYLVDQTVNFGAVDIGDDGAVTYIVKALTGGYDAGFSPVDFFFHHANYGENELRDLWEYRLNLDAEHVRYIVAHAWEVNRMRYVYRFFHDNCAFRVAELLQVVEGIEAVPPHRPWIVPQAVLQTVARQSFNGHALLGERQLHPSRQTRLYRRYGALSGPQRNAVDDVVHKRMSADAVSMSDLPVEQRQAVLDTLMDYYQFYKENPSFDGGRQLPVEYVEALSARLRLPAGDAAIPRPMIEAPDSGHPPGWAQVGIAFRHGGDRDLMLRIRPAYYDALDVSVAQARHGGLSMGDIELELRDGSLRIHRLDIIAVDSINPAVTGLPGDRSRGWKVRAGIEQERIDCSGCWVGRVQGEFSLGLPLGSPRMFGAISVGAAAQTHAKFDGAGFVKAGVSMLSRLSERLGFRASHELRQPLETDLPSYRSSHFESRLKLGQQHDLRVRWERDNAYRLTVGVGAYW